MRRNGDPFTTTICESPLGPVEIVASDRGIAALNFVPQSKAAGSMRAGHAARPPLLAEAVRELEEYFAGERREFTVRLDLRGTPFELAVWRALLEVPFGRTVSYGELGQSVGKPGAARAVGGANHRNPVSIIVPCHRVVGADGGLTGYGGGLWRKKWLLEHEQKHAGR
jgi:methylated-DNA-[protein]-cysteine S-methyltransferase